MSQDRRNFLKLFGVSTAIMANAVGEPEVLSIPSAEVTPIATPNAQMVDMRHFMHIVDTPLYDKVTIEKNQMGTTYATFFTDVEAKAEKTYAETNLCLSCRLDAPECKLVRKVGLTFAPNTIRALRNHYIEHHALQLWISKRLCFCAPVSDLFTEDHDNPRDDAHLRGRLALEIPLILTSKNSFYVQLLGPSIPIHPKFSMYCSLWGPMAQGNPIRHGTNLPNSRRLPV